MNYTIQQLLKRTITKEEYIEELEHEWIRGTNRGGCYCSASSSPPCSFCESEFNCSMEDYVERGLEDLFVVDDEEESPDADYDRAMEIIK